MTREFRLPNGTSTTDVNKFISAWNVVRKPLESLGFRVIGFDPGITLCDARSGNGSFHLPMYAVDRFLKLARRSWVGREP